MDVNQSKYAEVKDAFDQAGISISEWARANGFSGSLVYQVLEGKRLCKRGQSHRIAVALGLKKGNSASVEEFGTLLKNGMEQR
jgi:gp16 family phage-associated protein